ncbi:SMP-30/gluconolactonase/LRE family protein [Oxalobacteraceae bacterium A2-2]
MSKYQVEVAVDEVMQTGECPLWHPVEQVLYWVDIPAFTVHRWDPATGARRQWKLDSEPAALAHSDRGGLVVALRSGFAHLDTAAAGDAPVLTSIAPAPYDTATTRYNDGRVDGAGRFWVGTIYEPRDRQAAEMYVLEKGKVRLAWAGGATVSNGLGFSPDQTILYHADTTSHQVRRYDYDLATGTASNQRLLRQFSTDKANHYGGRPDGAAVDSEGNYWSAQFEGARIVKLSPEGEILDQIALPARCPTMVAFGGADLRTLYITSAGARPAAELEQYAQNGKLLSVRLPVPGRAEPAYRA